MSGVSMVTHIRSLAREEHMSADRYTKGTLTVIAAALVVTSRGKAPEFPKIKKLIRWD
jgi:hypothetical protein